MEKLPKLMKDKLAGDSLRFASTADGKIQDGNKWHIKAMERDIPNTSMYKSMVPCPLGYLTAADKVYLAYPLLPPFQLP